MPSTCDLTPKEFSDLAHAIWKECYSGIISDAQIDYMLGKFQSPEAIAEQIADGYVYKAITDGDAVCGYSAHVFLGGDCFVSKFYVSSPHRRRGLGSWRLSAIFEEAEAAGAGRVHLFVNKGNTGSVSFYESLGMEVSDSVCVDIGGGFAMDDFVLEKRLPKGGKGKRGE
ncbi:MAG: GNAT family N-acetyltransferase [Thermoplasmatales archaeon]|nr:GNAT family N-acetyltransferase [Thermoplasmatales archaeon]